MYESGGRYFETLSEASAYANWIATISGLIIAVTLVEKTSTNTTKGESK